MAVHPNHNIDQDSWEAALCSMVWELEFRIEDRNHTFHEDGPWVFEFKDPKCKWNGTPPRPKSFRLCRRWGPDAIQSHLGGSRRSDWSKVARVCQFLCDEFPRQLALVVSEGISRYDDETRTMIYNEGGVLFYDGTGYWKEVDQRKWPWTNVL